MTRQKRERVALLTAAIFGLVIFAAGFVFSVVMQERSLAKQTAAWGPEMTCSVSRHDPATGLESPLIAVGWRQSSLQREVTVTCPIGWQHQVMMTRENSLQPTTSVWLKSDQYFVRGDVDNGSSFYPPTWAAWDWTVLLFALLAGFIGWLAYTLVNGLLKSRDTSTEAPAPTVTTA